MSVTTAAQVEDDKYDVLAERAVIAGLYSHGSKAYFEIDDIVDVDTFTIDTYQIIFRCLKRIFETEPDTVIEPSIILVAAKQLGCESFFDNDEEQRHIRAVASLPVTFSNIKKYAVQIKKLQLRRQLTSILDDTIDAVKNSPIDCSLDDLINLVEQPVTRFSNCLLRDNEPQRIGEGIDEYVEWLEQNKGIIGISSGFKEYDAAIGGGFRRQTVSLIGARLKAGKSSIAEQISIHVTRKGIPVLNIDTEMGLTNHWKRLIANISNVTINDLERGIYRKDQSQIDKVNAAVDEIKQLPYDYISVAGQRFEDILSQIRRWILTKVGYDENHVRKDCLIIFDYLKIMSQDQITNQLSEHQAIGFLVSNLHNFSVKYNVPFLTFTQLNRDALTRETTDVISQSDRLGWFCSNVSIFKTKSDEEIAEDGPQNGNRKMVVLAARDGPGMPPGEYLNFDLRGEVCQIEELKLRSQTYAEKKQAEAAINDDFSLND